MMEEALNGCYVENMPLPAKKPVNGPVRPRSWILIYWSLHDIPLSFFTIYIRVPRSCEWLSAVYPLDKEVTHRGGETTFPSDASVH
jgi:hypothetical protein